jgi:DNA-binding NtrC family response regulator
MLDILIVDDDPDTCDYLRDFLGTEGHTAQVLQDPTRVLESLKNRRYHLILLDIMMPRLSGIQVLQQIRNHDRELPVAIFTGYPEVETAIASIQLNVVGYLKKPFAIEELKEILEKAARKQGLSPDRDAQLCAEVGRAVRTARKDRGLTLKDLAQRTRLSVSLLSQIERGEGNPTILNLFRIAQALDLKLSDVFKDF